MIAMSSQAPGIYQDVINIHYNKAVEEVPEHLIHEVLEYGGGLDQVV